MAVEMKRRAGSLKRRLWSCRDTESGTMQTMWRLFRLIARVVLSPRSTLDTLAVRPDPRQAAGAVLLFAVTYSAFCWLLWLGGHQPSRVLLAIPRDDYYFWQGLILPPLFLLLWLIFAFTVHGLVRVAGGRGGWASTLTVTGFSYGPPLLLGFVLPDLLVYLVAGFEHLAVGMRFYAPLAVLWVIVLAAWGLARAHRLSLWRTGAIAWLAFVIQAAIGGIFVR